jgi:hypothetical protein
MVHKLGMHHSLPYMLLVVLIYLNTLCFLAFLCTARPIPQGRALEFRGSSPVSFLRPWAHQHEGKGRIGG